MESTAKDFAVLRFHPGMDLSAHQSAVDRNQSSGHIIGKVGRQKLNDFRAILDRSEPP